MGNTNNTKISSKCQSNVSKKHRLPNLRFSDWSLSNLADSLSIRWSFVSRTSQQTTYSTSRPWSRISRRCWQDSTLNSPWESSKTAWPVSQIEALFLPEFKIQGGISEKDFELIEPLKKGAFGNVVRVRKLDMGAEYAMKILSKSKIIAESGINQVKDEVRIQTMCGHNPFIVGCVFSWQNKKQLFIVSTYMNGGEMFDLLQAYKVLPEEVARLYIAEIALAIDFLHSAGVIYRDLKPENILLDNEGHAHLTDFGLSKCLKYGCRTNTICGTLQYMAPEVLEHFLPYGHSVDWWSLGVVACLLLTGKYPVEVLKRMSMYTQGGQAEVFPNILQECCCSLPAKDLILQLLQHNPRRRLKSMLSLQNTSFYRGFNFVDARAKKISPRQLLAKHFPQGPPESDSKEYTVDGF